MSRTVLILGGGVGGIVCAETLRKKLPASDRVVLVEKERTHHFAPSLLWLMTGDRRPEDFSRPMQRLADKGIELVTGSVSRIDPAGINAEVNGSIIQADALVVALGAEYAFDAVPGLAEHGLCLYTLEGALKIRDALAAFKGGRIVVLTAAPAYKCPAAPYEAAMLIEDRCRQLGLRHKAGIAVYAAEPMPMPTAGPVVAGQVRQMVEGKGIVYFPEHQVERVEAGRLHFRNGAETPFDLLIYVPPHRAPAVVREAGLVAESGWVAVDRHTLATKHPNVWALGDVTAIPLANGRPLPKAGVFAHAQAEAVASQIVHTFTGAGGIGRFDGRGGCFVEIGGGMAGMGSGDFYAEPAPQVRMRYPNPIWHWGKILYEKYWLWSRF